MFNDISTALSTHLSAMPDVPRIAYENAPFTPVEGELYLSEFTRFETSQIMTLKGKVQDRVLTYQVTVYAPIESQKHTAQRMAGDIVSHFNSVDRLTKNGHTVEIHEADVKGSFTSGAWYAIPVQMRCRVTE